MKIHFQKQTAIRLLVILLIAFLAVGAGWRYINKYLYKSKAGASAATLSLIPSTATFADQETKQFTLMAQFTDGSASEKIDYFKAVINFPKESLNLDGAIDTTSSGLDRQMRVDGPQAANSSGYIVIEIGAVTPGAGPATNSPITVAKINFRGIAAAANASISLGDVQIVNNASGEISVNAKNGATINVDSPTQPVPTATDTPNQPTTTPVPTATDTPNQPTTTPVPTAGMGNVKLNLKLKFQGIMDKRPTETLGKFNVRVKLLNESTGQAADYKTAEFTTDDKGVWSGNISFDADINAKYTLYVKGPYHLQKKICDATPTETAGGTYRCSKGNITLVAGDNNLDFSGIISLAGDLPDQNGTVSSYDTSLIYNNLGKTDNDKCDVNRDGICNTQDYSLVIASLSVKNDEE